MNTFSMVVGEKLVGIEYFDSFEWGGETFVVSKGPASDRTGFYQVSHKETGLGVAGFRGETIEEVKQKTIGFFNKTGEEEFKKVIEKGRILFKEIQEKNNENFEWGD